MKSKYIMPMQKLKDYLVTNGEISFNDAVQLTGITVGNFNNFLTQFTYYCNCYEFKIGKTVMLGLLNA